MAIRFTNGICEPPEVGVNEVEFWKVIFQLGRERWKKLTKCVSTAVDPGVPGTRGCSIGARMPPFLMSKSSPGPGRLLRVSSERLVYATALDSNPRALRARDKIMRDVQKLANQPCLFR